MTRPWSRNLIAGAVVVVVVLVVGMVVVLATREGPGPAVTAGPTTTEAGCAPTRGESSQGTGAVAADAPSRGRLGPGGELARTAETLAAGRGGQRLVVSGTVVGADCATPLAGASLEVWQTNARGEYGPDNDACCYLAAALRTDERGRFELETVKPGHYKGEARPPPAHIHLEVRHSDAAGLLTELVFADDPWLGPDPPGVVLAPQPVPGSDPPALGAQVEIVLGPRTG